MISDLWRFLDPSLALRACRDPSLTLRVGVPSAASSDRSCARESPPSPTAPIRTKSRRETPSQCFREVAGPRSVSMAVPQGKYTQANYESIGWGHLFQRQLLVTWPPRFMTQSRKDAKAF